MSLFDHAKQSDRDFERSLLDSARKDAAPDDVQAAWTRFAGVMTFVGSGAEPGSGLHSMKAPSDAAAVGGGAKALGTRGVHGKAITWLLLGVIGGSGLTAALMQGRPVANVAPKMTLASTAPAPITGNGDPATAVSDTKTMPMTSLARQAAQSRAALVRQQPRHNPSPAEASTSGLGDQASDSPAATTSTLAAEVSRLDAARTASRAGAYDEAIRLIERYHRDFPNGALAPDAEVVAIEALAEKRDQAEVARRAASFLSQYPTDPHATRVRRLAER